MKYEKTVAAAVAETKSKFRLAEALAEEIPARRSGPTDDVAVPELLAEARMAIIAAGGEARSVETLRRYRETALWVGVEVGTHRNYRWVDGVSFTAHDEARVAGLSYEEFAAAPKTSRAIRSESGKRMPGGGQPDEVIPSWSEEEKREAARVLVAEAPDAVAAAVAEDDDAYYEARMKRHGVDRSPAAVKAAGAAAREFTGPLTQRRSSCDLLVASLRESAEDLRQGSWSAADLEAIDEALADLNLARREIDLMEVQ